MAPAVGAVHVGMVLEFSIASLESRLECKVDTI